MTVASLRWQTRNRDKHREANRRYRQRHPDRGKAAAARWRKRHPRGQFASDMRVKYGITLAQWDAVLIAQGGLCALCDRPAPLEYDHCHDSGRFRGLLCMTCNTALGKLGDTPVRLQRALDYVKPPVTPLP